MSSYAFFVQTCREEHKKKHPDASVNFSEFSKKFSERWKTMPAKEKGKFEDMAKADRACYEKEMKTYIPPKGRPKRSSRTSMHPRDLLRPSSCSVLSISPKSKENTLAYPLVMLQRNWERWGTNTAAEDKRPYEEKAAELKEKYEQEIAAYRAGEKPGAVKKGVVKVEQSKKKKEEEDDEEDEENEEEEEENDDDE
ncbi:hypothetical protein U0070_014275 [Myodes glareolus]|uniref:HMG box domain-containing protein n=1 Tax=Myodes glareolus TaxID=447135 RepID=A0AAW0I216_MYOGA